MKAFGVCIGMPGYRAKVCRVFLLCEGVEPNPTVQYVRVPNRIRLFKTEPVGFLLCSGLDRHQRVGELRFQHQSFVWQRSFGPGV